MRLIDPSYEIIPQEEGLLGVYKQIEKAARTAYKSEDKITEGSAQRMVESLCKLNHGAALEHGTIYLMIPYSVSATDYLSKKERMDLNKILLFFQSDKYSRVREVTVEKDVLYNYYITTNARVIFENHLEEVLQYMCEPTEYHEKRVTVKFITSVGICREILRHRCMSFLNESTRYCNYSKGKFNSELTFIIPQWIYDLQAEEASYPNPCDYSSQAWLMNKHGEDLIKDLICMDRTASSWLDAMTRAEEDYMYFITTDEGYKLKPEEARGILPLDLKSELIVTGFVSDWIHFFRLRSHIAATGKPHPDIQILADPLMQEFIDRGYCTYEEIHKEQVPS